MTQFASTIWDGPLVISSDFASIDDAHTSPHSGTDIISSGRHYTPFAGTVTRDFSQGDSGGGLGNYFQMVSDDGRFVYTAGHGNFNSDIGVRRGDHVGIRQQFAADYGRPTTGRSTGPHWHDQLTDNGALVRIINYLDATWDGSGQPADTGGWDGVSTDYKGAYPNNQDIYTVPVGGPWFSDIAAQLGTTEAQLLAYTREIAGSPYSARALADTNGGWWWDGSQPYYAGATIAKRNLVSVYAAIDKANADAAAAKAAEAKTAKDQAEVAQQIVADQAAQEAKDQQVLADAAAAEKNAKIAAEKADIDAKAKQAADYAALIARQAAEARKLLPGIVTVLGEAQTSEDANAAAPLSGLFSGNPKGRKRAYLWYSATALVVSFGPDIVTANVLADQAVPTFVAYISLATSILLKVGTAFGFVAASNIAPEKSDKD